MSSRCNSKPIEWKEENGCWICTSHRVGSHGYPQVMMYREGTTIPRMMFEECFGFIPKGMVVRHKCDNKLCINPEHLELGTRLQNWFDTKRTDHYPSRENHWNWKGGKYARQIV